MGVELERQAAGPGVRGPARAFLIADVRGYTSFTRERGDVEAARLATRFAALAGDAAAARSGEVVEVRGDEVFAVFPAAAQAVRAALELQATLAEETAADPSLPLGVGVGIDAGEAVPVGAGFRGSALNLAARLCGRAAAGQVLVSAAVAEQAVEVEDVRFQPLGAETLKGFEEPVAVYEALAFAGCLDTPPRAPTAVELPAGLLMETPAVGRERELAWLRGTWRSARRGRGRMVFVTGPPGIGKTGVAAALAAHVASQGFLVHYTAAGGVALAQVGEAVEMAASAKQPMLVVLDDLASMGATVGDVLFDVADSIVTSPVLVLGLIDSIDSSPALSRVAERADTHGDGLRTLGPLTLRDVAEIARGYAGDELDDVPVESIARQSGGLPAAIHELLDAWVREEAARRLGAAAEWLAAGRDQRAAQLQFANTAIERRLRRIRTPSTANGLPVSDCPYKGLASFTEDDAEWYFGRERLVGELAARTVGMGLLAVVGPSGSGKSSLVAAGLLPSLAAGLLPGSRGWRSIRIRPGSSPLDALPVWVLDGADLGRRGVLVVDQFEEVFTLCPDESQRAGFVAALVEAASMPDRMVVVLAIRADFLGQVAGYPALAQLVSANQVLISPMTGEEHQRAIELPARRCGVRVEAALTTMMVEEATGQAGSLPLLSTAMVELWARRSNGWIRMDSYRDTDGLRGAVARLAEAAYQQLGEVEQHAARRVFLRLAGSGEGDNITRRRVSVDEFDTGRDTAAAVILDRFVADRLLTRDDDTIEVAHEALLREWPRLREWLAEDAQSRQLHRSLTQASIQWQQNGRRAGDLYRAERLSAAADWSRDHRAELNTLEHEFLAAGQAANTRAMRRLRVGVAVLAVMLVASLVAGGIALSQRRSAQREAAAATREATVAEAQRLGAQALIGPRLDLSLLLAREAVNLDDSPATRSDLFAALLRSPAAIGVAHEGSAKLLDEALSPDGRMLAVRGDDGNIALLNAQTLQTIVRIAGSNQTGLVGAAAGPLHALAFSPDGRTLTVGGSDGNAATLDLVAVQSQTPSPAVEVSGDITNGVAYAPDGRTFATAQAMSGTISPSPEVIVSHNARTGDVLARTHRIAGARLAGYTRNGRYLLVVTSTTARLLDSRALKTVKTFNVGGSAALSPRADQAAIGHANGTVTLLDLATGRQHTLSGRAPGAIQTLIYSPHGTMLATATGDIVSVWGVDTGNIRETLSGHSAAVQSIAFSPDGKTLYTASLDGTVIKWDISGRRGLARPFRYSGTAVSKWPGAAVSPDGSLFAVSPARDRVELWRTTRLRPRAPTLRGPVGDVDGIAFSPSGALVAATGTGNTVVWDTRSGARIRVLPLTAGGEAVAFSPAGNLLAIGGGDGLDSIFNTHTWQPMTALGAGGSTQGISFSPNGKLLASASLTGIVTIWNLATDTAVRTLPGAIAAFAVRFSPDGKLIAVGDSSGAIVLWNLATGRRAGAPLISSGGDISSIDFDHHGRLITASGDGQLRLWDLATRTLIGAPIPAAGPNNQARLLPNGDQVLDVSSSGNGVIWNVNPTAWEARACTVAHRNLTRQEWSEYVGDHSYHRVCS